MPITNRTAPNPAPVTSWRSVWPPGNQHPAHLAERQRPVREELQTLLAEDDLERPVRERQAGDIPGPPLDRRAGLCRGRPGHLERALNQPLGPRREQHRHQVALVGFGDTAIQLPPLPH
jgi:hypothetical protein